MNTTLMNIRRAAVLAIAITASGCAGTNQKAATEMVEDAGYTNVQITGFDYWNCGTGFTNVYLGSRIEMTGFTATAPSGRQVSGTVCKGTFGDYTLHMKR